MVTKRTATRQNEISAGLLVFRRTPQGAEYLLAHPGGPYWKRKDAGAWSIPKGLVETGQDLLSTAKREFQEECGLDPQGSFYPLTPVKQKSGKTVHAFAVEADLDLSSFHSNTFEIEWPPRSGQRRTFPEIDRVDYFTESSACEKILAYQRPFIEELSQRLRAKAL